MTKPTFFNYGTNGLLTTKVDANGTRKAFTYDASQRVTAVRYYVDSSGVEYTDRRVDYYWDTNPFNADFSQNAAGRLTAMQYKPNSSTTVQELYSYEKDGRLTKKRLFWVVGSQAWQLDASYTFDGEGRPATLTYPDGSVVTYSYNSLG
jgi:YD repeat-containing protein